MSRAEVPPPTSGLSVGGRAREAAGISWVYCRVWHRVGCSARSMVRREVAEERAESKVPYQSSQPKYHIS